MPTYDYKCKECTHEFEAFQSIKDDAISICPICNGDVERIIGGGAGLIFKGSGFYITDYKNTKQSGSNGKHKPVNKPSNDSSDSSKK